MIVYILIFVFAFLLSYNFILGNVIEGMKIKKSKPIDKSITKKVNKTVNKTVKTQKREEDVSLLNKKVDKLTIDFKELNDKVNNIISTLEEDTDITPDIMSGVIEKFTVF